MRLDDVDVDYPRAVLLALLVATVLGLGLAASTSGIAFGAYNPAWDGTTVLRTVAEETGADTQVVLSTTAYERTTAAGTVAVVFSPAEPYTAAERTRVRSFVRRGGTLVVAEDYGPRGNGLLAGGGADARVVGRPLRDPRGTGGPEPRDCGPAERRDAARHHVGVRLPRREPERRARRRGAPSGAAGRDGRAGRRGAGGRRR
jgi:hypothetical protein